MSLDQDMMGADQDVPLATEKEIVTAIVIRHALNNGDILETAMELATLIAPYGLSLADIRDGLPTQRFR